MTVSKPTSSQNKSFAEITKEKIASGVKESTAITGNLNGEMESQPVTLASKLEPSQANTVAPQVQIARSELKPSEFVEKNNAQTQEVSFQEKQPAEKEEKKKRVLIGIYVTPEEQAELRQMFCSNGFSLSNAYRSAMTYLRQDIEQGKAFITKNSEILRK